MWKYYFIGVLVSIVLGIVLSHYVQILNPFRGNDPYDYLHWLKTALSMLPGGLLAGFFGSQLEELYFAKYIGLFLVLTIIFGVILSVGSLFIFGRLFF